ncbi:hypothetical protein ACFE04_017348 [Oxalis oulophora]
MEKYLNEEFEVEAKNESIEGLKRWRSNVSLVKNPRRRFRNVADLDKRADAEEKKRNIQEKIRVALYVQKAALQFIDGSTAADKYKFEYKFSVDGFELHPDEIAAVVCNRDKAALKNYGGVETVVAKLKTSLTQGITEEDIPTRQKIYGCNQFTQKPPKTFFMFLWDTLHDVTLLILMVCALASIGLGIPAEGWPDGLYDGLGIILAIYLGVIITSVSDYRQNLQFTVLNNAKEKNLVQVTRGGCRQEMSTCDLVVGDIVNLSIGDQIPADGIFISGYSLQVDESSLTGDSEPFYMDNKRQPFLLAGTKVLDGSGNMLVTTVGMRTEWGKLMEAMTDNGGETETPLQVKLNGVATIVSKIDLALDLLTLVALILRFVIRKAVHNQFTHWSSRDAMKILNFFTIAVTTIVAAVPEELPLAVTLGLAFASKKLLKQGVLVKRLSACETMGSATCICTDKTGTLTTKQMAVDKIWICGKVISAIGNKDVLESEISNKVLSIILPAIFINTGCGVIKDKEGKISIIGSPIEEALIRFGLVVVGDFDIQHREYKTVDIEPFNPVRKKMSVLVAHPQCGLQAFCKGAAESVISMCDKVVDQNGELVPFSEGQLKTIGDIIDGFASDALRILCLAFKTLDDTVSGDTIPDSGYTLIAIVGIRDPVRPGVNDAVRHCSTASIMVRMITGDNELTSTAVAKECGILTDGYTVIQGPKFREKNHDEMKDIIPKIQVIAKSSPMDKHTLVTHLMNMFGEVVAVTGDGINDAAALKEAHIGIAMGIAGTEVAKECADAIILDDNFTTILNITKWGRAVYINIQKFVQFQLTYNVVLLLINFISACFSGYPALSPVQMLWMKIIMDTLGGLALATLPPNDELMKKPPVGKGSSFITKAMWRNITGQSIYQLLVFMILIFDGKRLLHLTGKNAKKVLSTLIFNSFVLLQVSNELTSLDIEKINIFHRMFDSWIFVCVVISTVACQVAIVEFAGSLAGTVPLTWQQWLISILIASGGMLVSILLKCIPIGIKLDLSKRKHCNNENYNIGPKIA